MTWLLPALTIAFVVVLHGGAYYVTSPARGELATKVVRPRQDRIKSHPIRSFYIPIAVSVVGTLITVSRIFAFSSLEGQITAAALASLLMLGVFFTVRIRRWP